MLGKITGRTSTLDFTLNVTEPTRKFDYVQIIHDNKKVLCQILELEREHETTTAFCNIIGYRDSQGILKHLLTPPEPGTEVLKAQDEFIKDTLGLKEDNTAAYFGTL